ncbi:MAG TPA: guanylate kinase [Bacteroidales bacterium]|jgi:guanylate kinase|nr:guanylate kinase [Bacteroidales bacterium]HNX83353.1 guanylate kinase [Bacteroidales bacterium]HOC49379.1 guanylate kinase [Bacteroidales bacterium]HPS97694.1 guanylate kinase [Bacteroidales bacterium]
MRPADSKKVLIISAPSGAGKSTLVSHLLESGFPLLFSVSATSRKPRGNETDGREYYFITAAEFRRRIRNDEFIEWQEVYKNHYYGTLRREIERIRDEGKIPLFDVDVMGGINLKKIFGDDALSVFIMPPSVEELRRRLVLRGTDTPEQIAMRVEKASSEILLAGHFDTVVINDNLEKACIAIVNIVRDFIDRP